MSSANLKLEMGLQPMEIKVWWSWGVFCIIFSRERLNWTARADNPDGRTMMS
ncbi:hypothetical protein DPMN_161331 [Dreissena polymorpha]|uniref:Uncharacterized protein n=1 Tax=Dreissena polymorpha TaxID=45954 RepID=A0A9D4ISI3_DREPO|nr:hypothetical protein DPMN_161331 [Dreissena polymorpha]